MVHFYGANRHEIAVFWTGSIRGVQQAPRIRVYWWAGGLKGLVETLLQRHWWMCLKTWYTPTLHFHREHHDI